MSTSKPEESCQSFAYAPAFPDHAGLVEVLHLVSAPICVIDYSGNVLYANRSLEELVGVEYEPGLSILGFIHPDDLNWALEGLGVWLNNVESPALATGSTFVISDLRIRIVRSDGSITPVSVTGSTIVGGDGAGHLILHVAAGQAESLLSDILRAGADGLPEAEKLELAVRRGLIEPCRLEVAVFERGGDGVLRLVTASDPGLTVIDGTDPVAEAWAPPVGDVADLELAELPPALADRLRDNGIRWLFGAGLELPAGDRSIHLLGASSHQIDVRMTSRARLEAVFDLVKVVVQQSETTRSLEYAALHDPLTGLANRAGLVATAEKLEKLPGECLVLFLDTDRFKMINDVHGHRVGDEVIKIMGRRLAAVIREVDCAARIGGDEFVILAVNEPGRSADRLRHDMTARVRTALHAPYVIDGLVLDVTVSIGSTVLDSAMSFEEALARADAAMYTSKQQRRVEESREPSRFVQTQLGLDMA